MAHPFIRPEQAAAELTRHSSEHCRALRSDRQPPGPAAMDPDPRQISIPAGINGLCEAWNKTGPLSVVQEL